MILPLSMDIQEETLWEGTPSQYLNVPFYLLCLVLCAAFGLGLILALYRYFETKTNTIKVTSQRIIEAKGVFSRSINELELYRIRDLKIEQPFWLRLFDLKNICVISNDHSHPVYMLEGIGNAAELKEKLRAAVEKRRDIKKVREVDVS